MPEKIKEDERAALRRRILTRRDQLSGDEIATMSRAIAGNLKQLPAIADSCTIFTFVNYRSEPETLPLIRHWLAEGRTVAVPRTIPGSHMEIYRIADPDRQLAPGYCAIPEPIPEKTGCLSPSLIDTVIVPGSVFDARGGRLGYGGGYYDKFLSGQAPAALRIGICFELQIVEQVPVLPHDEPLDLVVTEKRIIDCRPNQRPRPPESSFSL